jgi:hypothetical protein
MTKRDQLNRIEVLLSKLDAAVVVRDPGNARSAEQFEGLRKQIGLAAKNHRVHVSHLLSLADSIHKGASIELLSDRVNDFLLELGVERLNEVTHVELFEITESIDAETDGFEVIEPAIVEVLESGSINPIRLGKARKLVAPRTSVSGEVIEVVREVQENTGASTPPQPARPSPSLVVGISVFLVLVGFLLGRFVFNGSDSADSPSVVTTTVDLTESTEDTQTTSTTSITITPTTEAGGTQTTEG